MDAPAPAPSPLRKPQSLRRLIALLTLVALAPGLGAYRLTYREQLYELHHRQLYMYDEDITENIKWLEMALRAPFANPLNALARIRTPQEWEKYRYLFTMHLDLKLVELYLLWGAEYTKFEAYFYNAPFKEANLESLDIAEKRIQYALVYWEEAKKHAAVAATHRWINLNEVQEWEDELYRIQNGELDYETIINKHLQRIARVRATFRQMDGSTY